MVGAALATGLQRLVLAVVAGKYSLCLAYAFLVLGYMQIVLCLEHTFQVHTRFLVQSGSIKPEQDIVRT